VLETPRSLAAGRWAYLLALLLPAAAIVALAFFAATRLTRIDLTATATGGLPTAALALLTVAMLSGGGAMILIETAKRLFGLRGRFQRRMVFNWLAERGGDAAEIEFTRTLVRSGSRADTVHLFDLPIDQVSAQLAAAADLALATPWESTAFLVGLTGERGLVEFVTERRTAGPERAAPLGGGDDPRLERAQTELAHRVRSGLDLVQISVGQRWRRTVRTYAVALSGVLGFAVTGFAGTPGSQRATLTLVALLFGGFFAWFARDLVAAVERLRG
jgi:hypothetical protein